MSDRTEARLAVERLQGLLERLSAAVDLPAQQRIWGRIRDEAAAVERFAIAALADRAPGGGDARKSLDAAARVLRVAARLSAESAPERRADTLRRLSAELRRSGVR